MRKQITLSELVTASGESERATLYHIMPGIVSAYYPGTATTPAYVDVTPGVNDVRKNTTTGDRISEPWMVIPKIPILFLYCSVYFQAGPMAAGDKVVLLGFDLDPTAHMMSGNPEDPPDPRRHSGSYWCAIPADITVPGAFPDGAAIANGLCMGVAGGQAQIQFNGSADTGSLGATPTDFIALASLVNMAFANMATWVKTGVASPSGGTVTYAMPAPVANVGSTLWKAQ